MITILSSSICCGYKLYALSDIYTYLMLSNNLYDEYLTRREKKPVHEPFKFGTKRKRNGNDDL